MPAKFSERKVAHILARIAGGESLRKICTSVGDYKAPISTFSWLAWLKADEALQARYAEAMQARADRFFEEIAEIADAEPILHTEEIQRGKDKVIITKVDSASEMHRKTRIDARKWIVARLSPKKYGDRMTAELTGEGGGPIDHSHKVTLYLPHNPREDQKHDDD